MKINITEEQAEELSNYETVNINSQPFKIIAEGDFVNDYKDYDIAQHVIFGDGKFWFLYVTRAGSYYSDYNFMYGDYLQEVEEVEITRKEWQVVD